MSVTVVAAMSGGVDSSVAAALLCQRGYRVIAMTLRFWPCEEGDSEDRCCGLDSLAQVRAVASLLGVPHSTVDCREEFEGAVLRPSWEAYLQGRTPNPCVLCNGSIKFGLLLRRARALGADYIATGHHARIESDGEGTWLLRGRDPDKDQSYFLFSLSQEQRAAAMMPVGGMTKGEVRALARQMGFPNADRKESQDACLGGHGLGFAEALRLRFGAPVRPGDIVDEGGRVLGRHGGAHLYTLGQRRGLGLSLGRPAYVVAIDGPRNRVVVTKDDRALMAKGLMAADIRWAQGPRDKMFEAEVQIRYRSQACPASITPQAGGGATVMFHHPLRAVTPGQAVVFYHGDRVVGGGWIQSVL